MEFPIENKVEKANIHQIDLSDYSFTEVLLEFDLKQGLWQEAIIKEKEFRAFVKSHDWEKYKNHHVALFCSVEAIVPAWAFMLVSTELIKAGAEVRFGNPAEVLEDLFFEKLGTINVDELTGEKVMVKGCSDIPDPNRAYVELTALLVPKVKSLMFGEPCSAVPVFKKK